MQWGYLSKPFLAISSPKLTFWTCLFFSNYFYYYGKISQELLKELLKELDLIL